MIFKAAETTENQPQKICESLDMTSIEYDVKMAESGNKKKSHSNMVTSQLSVNWYGSAA
ncbi:hypothetical protein HHI36_002201, partial [Cryptolaemus montrouzieri]